MNLTQNQLLYDNILDEVPQHNPNLLNYIYLMNPDRDYVLYIMYSQIDKNNVYIKSITHT